jgi:hypothetical protein
MPRPGEPGISAQSLLLDLAADHLDTPVGQIQQLAETR